MHASGTTGKCRYVSTCNDKTFKASYDSGKLPHIGEVFYDIRRHNKPLLKLSC